MASYVLGPIAGTGVRTYWSAADVIDARTRQDQEPTLTFGHHQSLEQDTIATSSAMTGTSAAPQQRYQVVPLSSVDRQLNCTTPRESILMNLKYS